MKERRGSDIVIKSEFEALGAFAKEIAEGIKREVIDSLSEMTETLSGEDSELTDVWDEICVQIQYEESIYWDAYDETVRALVSYYVEELKDHQLFALWLQTDEGWDWSYELEELREKRPPVFRTDIVQYLTEEYIYNEAVNWTNERIQAFLNRQYMGLLE